MVDDTPVVLDGRSFGGDDVVRVARYHVPVIMHADGVERIEGRGVPASASSSGVRCQVYGRTTGVGANRDQIVTTEGWAEHGLRLLRSHAGGLGGMLPEEQVRVMMVVRLNQLWQAERACAEPWPTHCSPR